MSKAVSTWFALAMIFSWYSVANLSQVGAQSVPLQPLNSGSKRIVAKGDQSSRSQPSTVSHRAWISLDPVTHQISIIDTVLVPAHLDSFNLNSTLQLDESEELCETNHGELTSAVVTFGVHQDSSVQTGCTGFILPAPPGGISPRSAARMLRLAYHGTFYESVEEVAFSREKVGGEIRATISEEGIYLANSANWLPNFGNDVLVSHHLIVQTPLGIEPVTQGKRTRQEEIDGRLITVWAADLPSDGLNLVAGRYVVTEEKIGHVTIATYLLGDDKKLSDLYLERTKAYLTMYEEMIGPYPYGKFATVENWFPTGYGMPSYTLLGGMVLRLPFIPYTSFGHEICHNWWGNSVFVDLAEGNWCEGLTVYCADYHYKELESPVAAREYRRNLLKDYAAYVRNGNDFPLNEFESRHSGATRAVGYGKSMMVFHMVDRMIGREKFLAALRVLGPGGGQDADAAWRAMRRSPARELVALSVVAGRGALLQVRQARIRRSTRVIAALTRTPRHDNIKTPANNCSRS